MFKKWFHIVAGKASTAMGSPTAFLMAVALIIVWLISGPFFQYSDTWELIINTLTTIITFLMVFLIQNTQNRDTQALHLKLDELINAINDANNEMIGVEELGEEELAEMTKKYRKIRLKRDITTTDKTALNKDQRGVSESVTLEVEK